MFTPSVSRTHLHIMHGAQKHLWMHLHFPPKMHMHSCMRAYATVQKLLCHESYCELILSLARASCRLSFAARPPAGSTTSVAWRYLLKKSVHASSWQCCTSKIRSSTLVQASSSLSIGRTRAWPRVYPSQKSIFGIFRDSFFIIDPQTRVLIYCFL